MEKLIELLKAVEVDSSIGDEESFLSPADNVNVDLAHYLANKLLVTKDGNCNWENIKILRDAGFGVYAVEQDGFGWLIGGIATKKGTITYG